MDNLQTLYSKPLPSSRSGAFYNTFPYPTKMPGKKVDGQWEAISATDRALMNASTSYVFDQIEEDENTPASLSAYLHDTINIYGKLDKQKFSTNSWLVLSSASGANPCAAYISLESFDRSRIIIDQTLYWYLTDSEDEAIYIVGLLNSDALSDAIKDFQPEGGFGRRHIHTLPYKIIPKYDLEDAAHIEVIARTRELMQEWTALCHGSEYADLLHPNSSSLSSRRRRQQAAIRNLRAYTEYESACHAVLG